MRGSSPTSPKTIERIKRMRAAGFSTRRICALCRCSTDAILRACGPLEPAERVRRATAARWPNGAARKPARKSRLVREIPEPEAHAEIRHLESGAEIPHVKSRGEIHHLTAEQRKNARDILNRLAGGQIEEPKTRPKRLSDEMLAEEESLRNYQCHGGASEEAIATAHHGIGWREIKRATKAAHATLRNEVAAGFERCAAREAYIRGVHA